jgi:hypothetical protein
VTRRFTSAGCFYLQDPDRTAGIRVDCAPAQVPPEGAVPMVSGVIQTVASERVIAATSVANLIRESKTFQIPSVMQTGRQLGMCMMNDSLCDLVKHKVVAPEEALDKAIDRSGLAAMLGKVGITAPRGPQMVLCVVKVMTSA